MDESIVVENLVKRFSKFRALDGISFNMEKKKIYLLIGPNGCGKTTLINCITGFYKPDGGRVYYNGKDITGEPMHKIARKGLIRTFQTPAPFFRLNVLSNMLLAFPDNSGENIFSSIFKGKWYDDELKAMKKVSEPFRLLGLLDVWTNRADELSGGQMKLLEMGRALMAGAETMILDEPVGSIAPGLCHEIFSHIIRLRDEQGLTFLIIEHRLEVATQYADHVFAMNEGKLICEGTCEEVLEDPMVIKSYLG